MSKEQKTKSSLHASNMGEEKKEVYLLPPTQSYPLSFFWDVKMSLSGIAWIIITCCFHLMTTVQRIFQTCELNLALKRFPEREFA